MAKEEDIHKWLNKKHESDSDEDFEAFEKIMEAGSKLSTPSTRSKEEAWSDLMAKVEDETKTSKTIPLWTILTGVAAVITLLIVGYVFVLAPTQISAQNGEQMTHMLPDGSEVVLNAGSELTYNSLGWSDNRTVHLNGEAFFEVTKGAAFTIESSYLTVSVLGTSFNAYLRPDKQAVHCFTGKVKINSAGKSIILNQGEAFLQDKKVQFNAEETASWRSGIFRYQEEPLTLVVNELERQFDIIVESEKDLSSRVYTGYFSNKDLDEALERVFKPMGLSYEIAGRTVRIE